MARVKRTDKTERKREKAREHLFQGEPDARQTADEEPVGLFRKRYRKLDEDEIRFHDDLKAKADDLAAVISALNPGVASRFGVEPVGFWALKLGRKEYDAAGVTLALRHLEDAVYRAVKALTA